MNTATRQKFSDEEIRRQLRLGEDSHWEFKQIEFNGNVPKSPSRNELADEFTAFANTDGGVVLCGVKDSGEVQGMSHAQMDALERLLVEICTDSIRPPIRPTILRREVEEEKPFLLVEVPQGSDVHESQGSSYIRVGSTKRRMTNDERLRLAQRRGQARFLWFDKQPVPETGFGTLDEALWKPLLSTEGAINPEAALEKMGLLTRDENGITRATVAGVLFCSRTPEQWLSNACITATCYRGEDRASGQIDTQIITGPLNEQIENALAFSIRNMRVGAYKSPARTDLPQYSEAALFEAIVNAVAHRDYSIRGSRIRISMFAERIEINSPGGLPNNLTLDSMELRQSTRNETIASVLGRISVRNVRGAGDRQFFMERRGDGVPTIRRETQALSGKLPEYQLIDDAELSLKIPAAATEATPTNAVIFARHNSMPLPGVEVLVLFPDKTWQHANTDDAGEARVELHATRLPMKVFAAAPNFAAHVKYDWLPAQGALAIEMQALSDGGSVIFPEATGSLPGLTGRLNPILDAHERTYLYASNIAINEGQPQPVHFIPGEELRLTDAYGKELMARIVAITGRSALVEYRQIQ